MASKLRFPIFASFILCSLLACAEVSALGSAPDRYRVFLLKNISPEDGKRLLAEANITGVSQIPGSDTLLISAKPEALVKAAALLALADSPENYAVKALLPVSEANKMPSAEYIQAEIGGISIGTFFDPPGGTGLKAIIDVQSDMLFAVAPAEVMDKIVAIAERAKQVEPALPDEQAGAMMPAVAQSVESDGEAEPDKLYQELLDSLTKAEEGLLQQPEPNQPSVDMQSAEEPIEPGASEPNAEQTTLLEPEANLDEEGFGSRTYEPKVIPNAEENLQLSLPEKLEVIQLLDLVGKYLNLNYVYDPKQLIGREVHLKVQGPVKVGELYPLVESVLKFTNLAMSRKGNLVTIVPLENALDIDPTLIEANRGTVEAGDVIVTRIFELQYVDTAQAKSILEQMKLGAVTELPGLGTIIVTGYAYRMSRIEQLLEVIDKPGKPREFRFRQLKYTMAKTLAPKIKELVEQLGDVSIAIAGTEPSVPERQRGRRPAPRRTTPTPTPEPSKPTVYLDADERTNRVLMIGNESELDVVEDLIGALDVAQQDLRSLRVYEIQHVDAEDVRAKLAELGIIGAGQVTTPGRITRRTVAQQQPGTPPSPTPTSQTGGGEVELPTEETQVVVIESTNSLMVNASPEQHVLIATIIAYVDSESVEKAIPYVVYPLQNQPPGHIAEVLSKLVQEVVQDKEGKIERVPRNAEENIIIVPDPNTFSLIVYASKKNQDWISSLIRTLDKRRPQVLIDVTLVEITNTDKFDLDLQLASKLPAMVPGGNMDFLDSIVGGASSESTFLGNSHEVYSYPGRSAELGGGVAQGFYSDRHIQALLTAIESKSYGRVLAKPKILVNDGQKGIIKTTDTTNVEIQTTIVPEQGNSQISTSYKPYEAGITLEIQPNISEGDLLLLIVKLDRTDFLPRDDTSVPPDTRANTVDTIVTVPNEKTIILGGLLKLNQGKGGSKVPLLGDIPLLGGLFRSTSNSVSDSKLYVFVKANILRPEAILAGLPELERISDRSRAAFERSEEQFQKYEAWPGIRPKAVEPLKVLEAE